MNTRMFHFSMAVNVLHIAGLWYLNEYVKGQPELFYFIVRGLIFVYVILSIILLLSELGKHLPPPANRPPKNS